MTPWVSPVPEGVTAAARVYRPGTDTRVIAALICERAWKKGHGVRVFRWDCGTIAVVLVGSLGDDVLLKACEPQLLVTYARHGLFRDGDGPKLMNVLQDLRWMRASAA